MKHDRASIQRCFSDRGLRLTRQRYAIFQALATTRRHPTADELYRDVSTHTPVLSLATVYNTLEAFCRVGLAQKIASGNGATRYDANCENHLHLRSQKTGEVSDAPDHLSDLVIHRLPRKALQEVERQLGFKIRQIQVELVGEFNGRTHKMSLEQAFTDRDRAPTP